MSGWPRRGGWREERRASALGTKTWSRPEAGSAGDCRSMSTTPLHLRLEVIHRREHQRHNDDTARSADHVALLAAQGHRLLVSQSVVGVELDRRDDRRGLGDDILEGGLGRHDRDRQRIDGHPLGEVDQVEAQARL
jgi:hypothetical protein